MKAFVVLLLAGLAAALPISQKRFYIYDHPSARDVTVQSHVLPFMAEMERFGVSALPLRSYSVASRSVYDQPVVMVMRQEGTEELAAFFVEGGLRSLRFHPELNFIHEWLHSGEEKVGIMLGAAKYLPLHQFDMPVSKLLLPKGYTLSKAANTHLDFELVPWMLVVDKSEVQGMNFDKVKVISEFDIMDDSIRVVKDYPAELNSYAAQREILRVPSEEYVFATPYAGSFYESFPYKKFSTPAYNPLINRFVSVEFENPAIYKTNTPLYEKAYTKKEIYQPYVSIPEDIYYDGVRNIMYQRPLSADFIPGMNRQIGESLLRTPQTHYALLEQSPSVHAANPFNAGIIGKYLLSRNSPHQVTTAGAHSTLHAIKSGDIGNIDDETILPVVLRTGTVFTNDANPRASIHGQVLTNDESTHLINPSLHSGAEGIRVADGRGFSNVHTTTFEEKVSPGETILIPGSVQTITSLKNDADIKSHLHQTQGQLEDGTSSIVKTLSISSEKKVNSGSLEEVAPGSIKTSSTTFTKKVIPGLDGHVGIWTSDHENLPEYLRNQYNSQKTFTVSGDTKSSSGSFEQLAPGGIKTVTTTYTKKVIPGETTLLPGSVKTTTLLDKDATPGAIVHGSVHADGESSGLSSNHQNLLEAQRVLLNSQKIFTSSGDSKSSSGSSAELAPGAFKTVTTTVTKKIIPGETVVVPGSVKTTTIIKKDFTSSTSVSDPSEISKTAFLSADATESKGVEHSHALSGSGNIHAETIEAVGKKISA